MFSLSPSDRVECLLAFPVCVLRCGKVWWGTEEMVIVRRSVRSEAGYISAASGQPYG